MYFLWPLIKWVLVGDTGLVLAIVVMRGWLRRRAARQWHDAVLSVRQQEWRQQKRRHQ